LLLALTAVTGPLSLVPRGSASIDDLADREVRVWWQTPGYLLVAGTAGAPFTLTGAAPLYAVYPFTPEQTRAVAAVAPVLLDDRGCLLIQLDDSGLDAVRRIGAQAVGIPETPRRLTRPAPVSVPRALRPDSLIQRIVNRVSADSVRAQIQRLVDFRTRYTDTDSCRSAERYIRDYFAHLGLDSVALSPYTVGGDTYYNPVGMIRGTIAPERLVIVCGHLDCESEDHFNYAPGAEDNASGTAMAMEAARVLAGEEFETSVMFVGFSGEEQGLWGSFRFVQQLYAAGRPVVGALNFDMIAWPGGQFGVTLHCDSLSEPLAEFEARMAGLHTLLDCAVTQQSYGSDQLAFMYFGYPATAGAEYGDFYPWYHTTADTMGNLNFGLAAEVAKMAAATAAALGSAPAQPADFTLRDAGSGGTLRAGWQPSPSPDVERYKVLWGTEPGRYDDSADAGGALSHNIGGLQNGTRYYATVVAIDSGGNEGFPAPEQSAVPNAIPAAPTGFAVLPFFGGNALAWRANLELDLTGYRLYRSTLPTSGFELIAELPRTDTTRRDSALLPDTAYYYCVTAIDGQYESERSPILRSKPISLDHGILLVDETRDGNGTRGNPSDAQQDEFYHACLNGHAVTDWDCATRGAVPLAGDVGPYSTIVWHADDYTQQLVRPAIPGLDNYLAAGGRLLYSGWKPIAGLLPPNTTFPTNFAPGSFLRDRLHLAGAGQSLAADFIGATGLLGYPSVRIDSMKMYANQHGRFAGVDVTWPADAEAIATFVSATGDTFQDKPVGTRWLAAPGKSIILGFPLYYLDTDEAVALVGHALGDLGEVPGIADAAAATGPGLRLPTIHRGILRLPRDMTESSDGSDHVPGPVLLDAAGRKAIDLQPGANDVSRLAPGVYFLRREASIDKVVITR
jgi:hypothetical protein